MEVKHREMHASNIGHTERIQQFNMTLKHTENPRETIFYNT